MYGEKIDILKKKIIAIKEHIDLETGLIEMFDEILITQWFSTSLLIYF